MNVGKTICDWCGIDVLWDQDLYTEQEALDRHKNRQWGNAIFEPMIALLHKEWKEKHEKNFNK
jgi:hypothetical protein